MLLVVTAPGGSRTDESRAQAPHRGETTSLSLSQSRIPSKSENRNYLRKQVERLENAQEILLTKLTQSRIAQRLTISAERAKAIVKSVSEALADSTVAGPLINFGHSVCSAIKLGESKALKKLLVQQLSSKEGLEEFIFKRVVDGLNNPDDKKLLQDYRQAYKSVQTIEEIRDLDKRIETDPEFAGIRNLLTKVDSIALLRKLAVGAVSPESLSKADKNELSQELAELTLIGVANKNAKNVAPEQVKKLKGIYGNLIENCNKPEYQKAAQELCEELSKLLSGHFIREYIKLATKSLCSLIPGQSIAKCIFTLLPEELQRKLSNQFSQKAEIVKRLVFTDKAPEKEDVITFRKLYSKTLTEADRRNLAKIFDIDPFFNACAPGTTAEGKVSVASKEQALELLNTYAAGGPIAHRGHNGEMTVTNLEPLSANARKAFTGLVTWYLGYRSHFPDPTETQPIRNIFSLITGTMKGELKWDICTILNEQGEILSAFSGQAIKTKEMAVAWGEHIYCSKEARGHGYGAKALDKFSRAAQELCGKTDGFVLEMDNPFAILDADKPENFAYFNHTQRQSQSNAWTDPNGMNMAMNPFDRMRVWHKLGFKLIAVQRKDLESSGMTAMPYTQIPLDPSIGAPCDILVMAIKPTNDLLEKINSGRTNAGSIFGLYKEMMRSISANYEKEPSYQATERELSMLKDQQVTLIDICDETGRNFNPKAIEILKLTAKHKVK